jgi:hypothetical protein
MPPAPPEAAVTGHTRRQLLRRVTAISQVGSVVALTSTGALVGWMARAAHDADAVRAAERATATAAQAPAVVPVGVPRPVRTVLVIRTAPAVPGGRDGTSARAHTPTGAGERTSRVGSGSGSRTGSGARGRSGSGSAAPRATAAPRPTSSPPATTTSGS